MRLNDKIINFVGDSITEGVGVSDILNNRYDNVIKKKCGLKAVYNYGISGTRLAHQTVASICPREDLSFCARAYDLNQDADIIIIYGGTNDYGHGDALFGEMTDKTSNTYCGAVDFLMRTLKEKYVGKTILFLTPARRIGDEKKSSHFSKIDDARPLKDYVDVIVNKGKEHNIYVLNLYEDLNINPNNDEDRLKYAPDGLHFNDEGHNMLADCIISFLKNT